ncbi:MAG: sugar phosphate isomerase/epimerase [Deltaproteobacteria bacterium]|nr:sugar phosphate isomerase/epimerase [Deltaproteobacteria bacterium]
MNRIVEEVHVSIPFLQLIGEYWSEVLELGINLEVGLSHQALDQVSLDEFKRTADMLLDRGIQMTVHAPFMDLCPGGIDPKMRRTAVQRLIQAIEVASFFKPKTIVGHLNYEERRYRDQQDQWLANSLETWHLLTVKAQDMGAQLVLENVYEEDAVMFESFFAAVPLGSVKFCLDVGHRNVWGTKMPLQEWVDRLAPHLGELHLHNNDGTWDNHQAVGCGNIDVAGLLAGLAARRIRPVITLEPHTKDGVMDSLTYLEGVWPW